MPPAAAAAVGGAPEADTGPTEAGAPKLALASDTRVAAAPLPVPEAVPALLPAGAWCADVPQGALKPEAPSPVTSNLRRLTAPDELPSPSSPKTEGKPRAPLELRAPATPRGPSDTATLPDRFASTCSPSSCSDETPERVADGFARLIPITDDDDEAGKEGALVPVDVALGTGTPGAVARRTANVILRVAAIVGRAKLRRTCMNAVLDTALDHTIGLLLLLVVHFHELASDRPHPFRINIVYSTVFAQSAPPILQLNSAAAWEWNFPSHVLGIVAGAAPHSCARDWRRRIAGW